MVGSNHFLSKNQTMNNPTKNNPARTWWFVSKQVREQFMQHE